MMPSLFVYLEKLCRNEGECRPFVLSMVKDRRCRTFLKRHQGARALRGRVPL